MTTEAATKIADLLSCCGCPIVRRADGPLPPLHDQSREAHDHHGLQTHLSSHRQPQKGMNNPG
jgi:hypothetical protein